MELKLYKVKFQSEAPARGTYPGGFAFILADTPEMAKKSWLLNQEQDYIRIYPTASPMNLEDCKVMWERQWKSTQLITGPFINGFVICNMASDY